MMMLNALYSRFSQRVEDHQSAEHRLQSEMEVVAPVARPSCSELDSSKISLWDGYASVAEGCHSYADQQCSASCNLFPSEPRSR